MGTMRVCVYRLNGLLTSLKKKAFLVDTCLEMHLTLNLGTSYKTDLFVVVI